MLRQELRALVELVLLPGLAAALPWRIAMRVFRYAARWERLYFREWQGALATARRHLPIADECAFACDFRLGRIVDHADLYLSLFRSRRRWLKRHATLVGRWPDRNAGANAGAVGVFFHVGPGLWAVHALRLAGHRSAVLAGHYTRRSMGGSWISWYYGVARMKVLRRASGCALIFAPGTLKHATQVIADGSWVIGTPDVPPANTRLGRPTTLLGRPAVLPAGLLEIAQRAAAPVVVFDTQFDRITGARTITIAPPLAAGDPALLDHIATRFETLLCAHPHAFSLWPFADAFFHAAEQA